MNEPVLDQPIRELAELSTADCLGCTVRDVEVAGQPQEEPLISIPGVGEIIGTLGENYPAFYWFMVEHVSVNGGSNDYQR